MNNILPKVSVAITTYNHEKYISQAIDSVLEQDYSNIEIIISDDCSKDGTRSLLEKYKSIYPDKIKLILNTKNLGLQQNFMNVINLCTGKYIALLDGDDYWTNENKISIQVDFLENNKEYAMCFHQARVKNETNLYFTDFIPSKQNRRNEFNIEDLFNEFFMPLMTVLVRNKLFSDFPNWYKDLLQNDRAFHLFNANKGKIKYLDYCMSVYRIHSNSIWSTKKEHMKIELLESKIFMLENFNEYTSYIHTSKIEKAINRLKVQLLMEQVSKNKFFFDDKDIKNSIYEIKERIQALTKGKSIMIFGTGEAGLKLYQFLNFIQVDVKYFIDNDVGKQNTELSGISIIAPETLKDHEKNYIFIASMYYKEISEQLSLIRYSETEEFINFIDLFNTKEIL